MKKITISEKSLLNLLEQYRNAHTWPSVDYFIENIWREVIDESDEDLFAKLAKQVWKNHEKETK